MSELPKGWTEATFDDVLQTLQNGVGGKQNKKSLGLPVSRIETIADESFDFSRIGFIEEFDKEKVKKHKLEDGDILFSHINSSIHLGKTAIFNGNKELYHGINLLRIVVNSATTASYFNYYCKYIRANGYFSSIAQHAVNQASINQKKLRKSPLVLAPLNEQIRIANKLDSLLAKVEATQKHLDKIPTLLKRFRQSVLAAAISGELIVSKNKWKSKALGELLESGPQNGIYKPSNFYGTGTKIIRIDGFYDGELENWKSFKRVEISEKELEKWKLKVNDILINRVNSIEYLGKCGLVRMLPEKAVFESNIMRISIKQEYSHEYIKIFLTSPTGIERLRENAKHAVNQASINQTDVKSCLVEIPPLEEQKQIVKRVEALFALADKVEQQYQAAKQRTDRLTQSLLAKAFRGELVPQDPNDELASELLKRIQADKT